ncbi:uncharacterized protein A4U43_C02F11710 [Asparagus officinalis]|uniref:Uncharacterized protein n=1 Tax=Asparagus officinalis TaxID=4686 RepID=A0A5P1FIG6_ASPOF|nr:uncharacterized protein A4U43_C02F11710 [Asparagus officinalis]
MFPGSKNMRRLAKVGNRGPSGSVELVKDKEGATVEEGTPTLAQEVAKGGVSASLIHETSLAKSSDVVIEDNMSPSIEKGVEITIAELEGAQA